MSLTPITVIYDEQNYIVEPTTASLFFKNLKISPLLCLINDIPSDLSTILSNDCNIMPVFFDDDNKSADSKINDEECKNRSTNIILPPSPTTDLGRSTFWHSSAHILGASILRLFPDAQLCSGPPTSNGFYYDFYLPPRNQETEDNKEIKINESIYPTLEKHFTDIIKENHKFKRIIMNTKELLNFYENNPFKRHYIKRSNNPDIVFDINDNSNDFDENSTSCVYTIGTFDDFCSGPHIPSTSYVKAVKILSHSTSYFLGNPANPTLHRIYATSFPTKPQLKKYLATLEIIKERDHRRIGVSSDLFFFNNVSPGSPFFLPNGTILYNNLLNFLRNEYLKRGFCEVITPNIYLTSLWNVSGHLQNYKENMFCFTIHEDTTTKNCHNVDNVTTQEFALKPMNCPGHCVMFSQQSRSYKDLPLRIADFGVLHRNEMSGALSGLTRVRRFQQDDAHIFCQFSQIESEMMECLDFMDHVYTLFNFKYAIGLSTRPEKYVGDEKTWTIAENMLEKALERFFKKKFDILEAEKIFDKSKYYSINKGDGAFYGPKIDITLTDAHGRSFQCATIQLDFNLPERFKLKYLGENGISETPIMIHRAILGSVERMVAIIVENWGVRMPFWISPFQVAIIPVHIKENPDQFGNDEDKMEKINVKIGYKEGNIEKQNQIGNIEDKMEKINVKIGYKEGVIEKQNQIGNKEGEIEKQNQIGNDKMKEININFNKNNEDVNVEETNKKQLLIEKLNLNEDNIRKNDAKDESINDSIHKYALTLNQKLKKKGFGCMFIENESLSLNKKIRIAETKGYKIIIVIGKKECKGKKVNVRGYGEMDVNELVRVLEKMKNEKLEIEEIYK